MTGSQPPRTTTGRGLDCGSHFPTEPVVRFLAMLRVIKAVKEEKFQKPENNVRGT
eukprot:m.137450 g.137450  ORF g.137450 m.137450 type:complete len:55 (+) comp13973_c0_seq2:427-591(+)